jgi:hypothetical protein
MSDLQMHWEIVPLTFGRARIIWTDGHTYVDKGY